ncbi:hypothetical protein [Bradyrhizobium sp. Tv2a-2]|uniref:hypothetical protein n=1 Tax=Bradyrhizobium sp. Tv2a-2 TaxID=113395 RepID=UPI0012EC3C25|nr:hypothetical protein [Bradyrhizobium sp. Tv2a-2]
MNFDIHTRPSTWLGIGSVVMTAFSAFPSWPSLSMHALNVGIIAAIIWQARREGRQQAS